MAAHVNFLTLFHAAFNRANTVESVFRVMIIWTHRKSRTNSEPNDFVAGIVALAIGYFPGQPSFPSNANPAFSDASAPHQPHPPMQSHSFHDVTGASDASSKPSLKPIALTSSTPPPIQLRNIVPKVNSPVTILQSRPGQVIKVIPAHQVRHWVKPCRVVATVDRDRLCRTVSSSIC